MNAGDRARWLDPSPPIPVDGEEPGAPTGMPPLDEPVPADEPEPGGEDDGD